MWLHDVKHLSSTLILHYVHIKECCQSVCSCRLSEREPLSYILVWYTWNLEFHFGFICLDALPAIVLSLWVNKTYLQSDIIDCTMIDVLNEGFNSHSYLLADKREYYHFLPTQFTCEWSPSLVLWSEHSGREWLLTKLDKLQPNLEFH